MLNRTNVVEENKKEENLDKEWVELMRNAYKMGISIEEVKRFIAYNKPS
ncbi:anti-repressor SinI family protein [Priestia megaterium]|nr:anti-repressor SinI family protein [Priestia megaterium]